VASRVRQPDDARSLAVLFPRTSAVKYKAELPAVPMASGLTALSVEFVANPEKAHSAPLSLPAAISRSLREVKGFSGCWMMVSDQEARLITVITFWSGNEAQKFCTENVKWLKALLSTYADSCLRVQTMYAHVPALPSLYEETSTAGAGLLMGRSLPRKETLASRSASY
jgi:hypothetical protein